MGCRWQTGVQNGRKDVNQLLGTQLFLELHSSNAAQKSIQNETEGLTVWE